MSNNQIDRKITKLLLDNNLTPSRLSITTPNKEDTAYVESRFISVQVTGELADLINAIDYVNKQNSICIDGYSLAMAEEDEEISISLDFEVFMYASDETQQ